MLVVSRAGIEPLVPEQVAAGHRHPRDYDIGESQQRVLNARRRCCARACCRYERCPGVAALNRHEQVREDGGTADVWAVATSQFDRLDVEPFARHLA